METAGQPAHIPAGMRSVNPYLIVSGASKLIDFMRQAFDAEEIMRAPTPDGSLMHAEVRIGDSVVELGDAGDRFPAMAAALHLYVPDADAVYARAMEAGATSLFEPSDREYGDREAGIKDPGGNHWYIATHRLRSGSYVPEGLGSVTLYLQVRGAADLIRFLSDGFGAQELDRHAAPDGRILHAKVSLGDSVIELSDAHGEWQPMTASVHTYFPDADAAFSRALSAGATEIYAPTDHPYGERSGGVLDPFGNKWWIATYTGKIAQP